jgi:Ca2+-binding RTX toxin-like protein
VVVYLAAGTVTNPIRTLSGTLLNVEHVQRSDSAAGIFDDHTYFFDDYLIGSDADNILFARLGSDTLNGGLGNDTLTAFGNDDVYTFAVAPGSADADVVTNFISGAKLQLDKSAYAKAGALGNFTAGDARFFAGARATSGQDATDRVIYNTSTGQLFYDADGSGEGAAQLIAMLQGAPTLAATDLAVIDSHASGPIEGQRQ